MDVKSRPATEAPGHAARQPAWWQRRRVRVAAIAFVLAVLHVALAVPAALTDGQTVDEPVHILAGYAILAEAVNDN